ncbi:MAG: 3-methyladenine DNA glycosylase [Balneolaceae bacterium]|nr:3-methyladenine DNA glycosylase [Balneolaceae bacterium]
MANQAVEIPTSFKIALERAEWQERKEHHEKRISEIVDDYLKRRAHHEKDPVMDFLFEYYAFRPSQLKRWTPGFGVLLKKMEHPGELSLSELTCDDAGGYLDPRLFPDNRNSSLKWILGMLEQSADKQPAFGCFGMHEWAMVYKADEVRHDRVPLRLSRAELESFVESRPLVCTHFDAYRFFTDQARPMNKFDLSRDRFADTEQPGCLHTNMDLYKWGFKWYPWISGDLLREAFELAVEARVIDMKASPYDLRGRGLEPIRIETEKGRVEYLEKQREIYRRSIPVRRKLIDEYRILVEQFAS